MKKTITSIILLLGFGIHFTQAEETNMEKAETVKNKTVDQVKKATRDVKDKTCEMVNGKLECVSQEVKHSAQSAVDAAKTKTKEIKNKIDNDNKNNTKE